MSDNKAYVTQDSDNKAYVTQDSVFIDTYIVQRAKRKARRLRIHLSTREAGRAYQECLEDLGLWEVDADV